METGKDVLEELDKLIEEESQALMRKNSFMLTIMNEIGKALDPKFQNIKELDLEANLEDFISLFNYFYSLSEKNLEKNVAIHLISLITMKIYKLDDNCEVIINELKEIIAQDNYLGDSLKRIKVMITLMDNFKPLLKDGMNKYLENYKKLFGMNIGIFFELIIYFLTDTNNEDLLYFTFKSLIEKYKKLIISQDILDSQEVKNAININSLNQLLLLKFSNKQEIVAFEENKFLLREPNFDEFHIQIDVLKKIENYSKGNLNRNKNFQEENITKNNHNSSQLSPKKIEIDPTILGPVKRYLYEELKAVNKKLENMNKKLEDNDRQYRRKFNDIMQENFRLKFQLNITDLDLKKIKLRSLYKGVIDIFASVYEIELNDYYHNKLRKILNKLQQFPKNHKVVELKNFLIDIYFYLQKRNCLAHSIEDESKPLEKIFSMIEKNKKRTYPKVKELLNSLSFNETLKFAENNYYSFKDQRMLVNNIKFSSEYLANIFKS